MRPLESHLTQEICKPWVRAQPVKYWFHSNERDFRIACLKSLLQPAYRLFTITYHSGVNGNVVRIHKLLARQLLIQFDSFSKKPLWSDRFEGPSQGCKAFGGSTASFFRQQDLFCCWLLLALRGIEVR